MTLPLNYTICQTYVLLQQHPRQQCVLFVMLTNIIMSLSTMETTIRSFCVAALHFAVSSAVWRFRVSNNESYVGVLMKCPIFSFDVKHTWTLSTYINQCFRCHISRKFCHLTQADKGWIIGVSKLIGDFLDRTWTHLKKNKGIYIKVNIIYF